MNKALLLSLLALSTSAHAATESHRLAFSKAENVEVFVDHPTGQPWCSEQLQLRFAFMGAASQDSVERLLPKLGSLLQTQCSQATSLTWRSLDQGQQLQAQGSASQADAWQAVLAQAVANVPAEPASEVASKVPTAAAPATQAPAQTISPEPATPTPASEPVVAEAAPATAPAAASVATSVATEIQPATTTAAPPVVANFSVVGWQPPLESEALAKAEFLTVLQDQQGCRLRTSYKPDVESQFLNLETSGLRCGTDGFLDGKGKAAIKRSDGALLKQFDGHFLRGLPIGNVAIDLPIVGFDNAHNLLLLLASDPINRVYYLALASHNSYHGRWGLTDDIIALSENVELFRQAESIRSTVMAAVPAMQKMLPNESSFHFQAMRDIDQGLNQRNRDAWLYEVHVRRPWRSKEWTFDPSQASNHLFNFERRQAEIARREAEQKAREEQRQREQLARQAEEQLRLYQSMQDQARNPQQLLASLIQDIQPGGSYRALMRGESRDIRQVVRVDGKDGDAWRLDYPYDARLSSTEEVRKGWYLVSGKVSLDPARLDKQDLPLTLLDAQVLQACEREGCSDMSDPLQLTRQRLNDSHWTPEAAQEQVRSVWPDRYPSAQTQE